MNIEDVKTLARLMTETGLSRLEFTTEKGETLNLERGVEIDTSEAASIGVIGPANGPTRIMVAAREHSEEAVLQEPPQKEGVIVTSPMVGVFYSAPSPDSDPFIQVGDQVKKGDVLCIIEAMKLMNEIQAEVDGTVVEICVGNGQVVEYDQPLVRIV